MHGQMATSSMPDLELAHARKIVRERITQFIQRHPLAVDWIERLQEIVMKVDEGLLKRASSKEEYMNMETLEQRFLSIVKGFPSQAQSRAHHISYSAPISTMIPTPGMSQNGSMNPSIISSADNTVVCSTGSASIRQSTLSSGGTLPGSNVATGYGQSDLFNGSDGMLPTSYQQPSSNIPIMQGGNDIMSSIGLARNHSQMIPTPGLNNQQSASMISGVNAGYTGLESTIVSQQLKQKQYAGPQNSRSSHNLGGQLGNNMRSNMQLKYDFSNGVINGGLGGNNVLLMDGSTQSESYLSASTFGNASNAMQQQADQLLQSTSTAATLPQQMVPMTGEGYGMGDASANGSLYASVVTTGSLMSQNAMSMPPRSKANTTLPMQHANIQSIRNTGLKTPASDGSQKMGFQASHSASNYPLQTQPQMHKFPQPQKFQQKQQQLPSQHSPQFVQHPYLQRRQNEPHSRASMLNNSPRQPLMTSDASSLMHELGTGTQQKTFTTQAPGQSHSSGLHSHYEQNTVVDGQIKVPRLAGEVSNSQDFQPSLSQSSDKTTQAYLQNDSTADIANDPISSSAQSETLQPGHWHPQALQSHILNPAHNERYTQQRFVGQDEAQLSQFFVDDSVTPSVNGIKGGQIPQKCKVTTNIIENPQRKQQYNYQIKWLLFLRHARWCSAPRGKCQENNCTTVQQLWGHMLKCNKDDCEYPRCKVSRTLIEHYRTCKTADCPVCGPVREYISSKRKSSVQVPTCSEFAVNVLGKNANAADVENNGLKKVLTISEKSEEPQTSLKRSKGEHPSMLASKNGSSGSRNTLTNCEQPEDVQPSLKRLKTEHSSMLASKNGSSLVSVSPKIQTQALKDAHVSGGQPVETYESSKLEIVDVKIEPSLSHGMENTFGIMRNNIERSDGMLVDLKPEVPSAIDCFTKQETVKVDKHSEQPKEDHKQDAGAFPTETAPGGKLGKPKIKGVSLMELFTPEQVKEHIFSLRQWVGQSKAKAEKNQAMEHNENSCQLCAVEKLTFEPPPIYCTTCGARIKRNAMYYTAGNSETRHYFCIPCYNDVRGDSIEVEGSCIPKAKLEKKRNDEETEEWWVQCDKCEAWQHQICALFNGRRNDGGQAEYTCPNCYIQEIDRGERKPLSQNAVLGAKDLPRTLLSDHIEQRLFKRLKEERQQRARMMGKSFDEVPGAESLVVRVVSSVDKKLDVKPRFLEIFQEENYPIEFPYKSKVVLLFQRIEGVEVCLFGMYVQEFGSECSFPNQRRVYLSYLDSVKYFRPEIKAVSGEALRTFVYHEILIGYLEYCKKRGFTSCYIWACPPLKGEDYILYCHPEIQKTPKSDKLREWYLAMLRKASKENIVADVANLYDHFFANVGESRAKITAARLPYFDGDYWPGAAEDMINQLQQEEDGRKQQKRGKTKKTLTKRALKAAGHTDLSGNISKDTLLMQKLGETICPIKEDFIMVHLQHACTHCCRLMVSGIRWVCGQCKNFQLCEKCYTLEQKREERERHPMNAREKHFLNPVEINDVSSDTKDKDEILESEFFDTRQAFLSLCQGNHYQYDTLRRAKHSSMMVLYHLHNPTAPAFVTTCNICQHDIETGQGWRCETCPDFDVCDNCYNKGVSHPHKLTNNPSTADAQNTEARQKRVLQLRKMLDLLVHASQCRFTQCQYPNCRKVKGLFRHGTLCKTRASGGCLLCKKMWYLLQLHARACKVSDCHVPRCRDLKEHLRRLQQQSDSRRRAAVMEMMRQRAAEVAGNAA